MLINPRWLRRDTFYSIRTENERTVMRYGAAAFESGTKTDLILLAPSACRWCAAACYTSSRKDATSLQTGAASFSEWRTMLRRWRRTPTPSASCAPCCTWLSACCTTTATATCFSRMRVASVKVLCVNIPPCTKAASMAAALASR